MEKIPNLQIELSSECNMTNICKHCYGSTGVLNKPVRLSEKILKMLIEETKIIADSITITGGEPAAFPNLTRRVANETGLPIALMTNGLQFIEEIKPIHVLFSLDGYDVRPGVKHSTIIKNVLKYNCELSCNTVLSKGLDLFNVYELMKELVKQIKVKEYTLKEWKLGFVIDMGLARKNRDIFIDFESIFKQLRTFLHQYFDEKPFPLAIRGFLYTKFLSEEYFDSIRDFKIDISRNPCLDCYGRCEILTINAEGNVQLCASCRDVSVPIEDSLVDATIKLLQKKELTELTYKDWKECLGCRYFNLCGAGCPALAITYGNEWTGKDVLQCEIMEKWEKYIVPILPEEIKKNIEIALRS